MDDGNGIETNELETDTTSVNIVTNSTKMAAQMGDRRGKFKKSKSKYHVSREITEQDSIRDEYADDRDEEVEAGKKFIDIFGRIIPFLYGIFAVGILAMYITGFVASNLKDIMIWAILGTSLVSSLLGAWAVYKYGVIQDQIDRLKEENAKYEHETNELETDTTSVNIVTNDGSNHIIKDMAESIELSKLCASSAKASKLCASSAKASKLCASSAKAAKESLQFILYIYIGVFMMFNEFSVDQIVAQNMNFSYLLTGQY
eukprot:236433_1